jgi:hypothetical protein
MLDFDVVAFVGMEYGLQWGLIKVSVAYNILSFVRNENGECNFQAVAMVVARFNIHVDAGVS